ncbi:hypothetical protein K7432_017344 [Basidiobolus ranarum]|uniref:NodB homology domain-containing protein n=1 Tax=Basidiobolus ranarum TaxID=34480 RepID=A0ABR2WDG8_9FUNG
MVHSLIKYSIAVALCLSAVSAQDSGNGFVFQCDKPGDFALTFDDGPSDYTGSLLSILSEKNVKATFFVLGSQVADSDIGHFVKQAYNAGHQIASHTYDHQDLSSLSATQVRQQMLKTEAEVKKQIGVAPAMMRPPYGNCNQNCQAVMKELGYSVIQWNVDSDDWKYMNKPSEHDKLVQNMLDEINPSDASKDSWISLQHDIHKFSVDRTPKIVDSIKAKGYRFVTVAQCLSNRLPAYKGQSITPETSSSTAVSTSASSTVPSVSTTASVVVSSASASSDTSSVSSASGEASSVSSTATVSPSASSVVSTAASSESTTDTQLTTSASTLPTVEAEATSGGLVASPMLSSSLLFAALAFFARI